MGRPTEKSHAGLDDEGRVSDVSERRKRKGKSRLEIPENKTHR